MIVLRLAPVRVAASRAVTLSHGCHMGGTLVVTRGPAHGFLDKVTIGGHAGSPSLRKPVDRCRPRVHIHGHLHYWFGRDGCHFDVASAGKKRAMIIDLETMEHEVVEEAQVSGG